MQVDAHQHFWRVSRGDYGWLTADDHPAICRDFGPDDLRPLIAAVGVERTVLVQAAPTIAETEVLLGIARATRFVAGVVGWADFEAADAARRIATMGGDEKLLGLRPMLQDLADDAWILRPELKPAFDAVEAAGLAFDALVMPRHLPHLARFLGGRPDLKVVIDHGAKPGIAAGAIAGWSAAVGAIARDTAAVCKLSGLVTEAGENWTAERLKPFADVLIEAFGPARLMWGSDWPVVNEAGGYAAWRAAAETLTAHLSAHDRAQIFGGTAAAFYAVGA